MPQQLNSEAPPICVELKQELKVIKSETAQHQQYYYPEHEIDLDLNDLHGISSLYANTSPSNQILPHAAQRSWWKQSQ